MPRHITLSEARSRLYRRRSLQVNSHFAAFFKICKIFTLLHRSELKFWRKLSNIFRDKKSKILKILWKIRTIFSKKCEFRAVQKCANLVDLEKCCKMTIWWPKSALVQPRTSLGKSDVSWQDGWDNACRSVRGVQADCSSRGRPREGEPSG